VSGQRGRPGDRVTQIASLLGVDLADRPDERVQRCVDRLPFHGAAVAVEDDPLRANERRLGPHGAA